MKRAIKILLFSDSWIVLALGMLGPIYAIFVQEIGGDLLDASWAYFTYMFTSGVVMYLLSHWEDRFEHKEKLIIIAYGIATIGCFSYLLVYDQISLLITQVILGLSMALLDPAYDSVYSHYVTRSSEASEWGAWEALDYVVTAIAALAGGYIVTSFGFTTLFLSMGFAGILATFLALFLLKDAKYLNKK